MCGIAGLVGKFPNKKNRTERMVQAMHHRGPDDKGIFDSPRATLGMSRLAILDLTKSGHQPMSNRKKTIWIVYNGEMYNFLQERAILEQKGYEFRSNSDTEVVLRMYEEYGDDFVSKMRGIFALVIYDKRPGQGKEKILLARDHLGIKPLLYYQKGKKLIFASEIKAILASGLVAKQVEPEALRQLLSYGSVIQPLSIIKDVKMLLPSHRLIFQHGKVSIEKYWHLQTNRREDIRSLSYQAQVKMVEKTLTDVVRQQMISEVPLGAFLSGGIDSSLLVAIMSKVSTSKIKTFSVGFEHEGKELDETDDALKIAKFLKTNHSKVMVSALDAKNNIRQIAKALDQPSVDGANAYFVSEAARKKVTVAISGTGGDELFAGYPWFANMMNFHLNKDSLIKKYLAKAAQGEFFNPLTRSGLKFYLEGIRQGDFLGFFARQYQIFGSIFAQDVLAEKIKHSSMIGREPALDFVLADELRGADPINRVSALCLRGYTQNQLLRDIDAVSMSHSLEVRVPFLDPGLTDLAMSLPTEAKLANHTNLTGRAHEQTYRELGAKKILVDIGKKLLFKDMDLQRKRGFTLPFNFWLRGTLGDILEETLSKKVVRKRGFFDPKQVALYYQYYLDEKIDWPMVWLLMMTELWAQEVLDA